MAKVNGRVRVFGLNSYGDTRCYAGFIGYNGSSIAAATHGQVDHIEEIVRECMS